MKKRFTDFSLALSHDDDDLKTRAPKNRFEDTEFDQHICNSHPSFEVSNGVNSIIIEDHEDVGFEEILGSSSSFQAESTAALLDGCGSMTESDCAFLKCFVDALPPVQELVVRSPPATNHRQDFSKARRKTSSGVKRANRTEGKSIGNAGSYLQTEVSTTSVLDAPSSNVDTESLRNAHKLGRDAKIFIKGRLDCTFQLFTTKRSKKGQTDAKFDTFAAATRPRTITLTKSMCSSKNGAYYVPLKEILSMMGEVEESKVHYWLKVGQSIYFLYCQASKNPNCLNELDLNYNGLVSNARRVLPSAKDSL